MNEHIRHLPPPIGSTVLGYPRIGPRRELKRALEGYWNEQVPLAHLQQVGAQVRAEALGTMRTAGLDSIPVNTFSHYDQVLDTTVMLGAVPDRFDGFEAGSTEQYFAMARGDDAVAPMEMTKWFDTNYHYLVPEIGPETRFRLDPAKVLTELREAGGAGARPVLIGPWTYLKLAKPSTQAPEGYRPIARLVDVVPCYLELLGELARAGAAWVQIDEPALVGDLDPADVGRVQALYAALAEHRERPAILLATYFGNPVEALPALAATDIEGIALDLTRGVTPEQVRALPGIESKTLVLGAVDGRNIWRNDLEATHAELAGWQGIGREVAVSSSCSLLHVPYDVRAESALPDALRESLAFAVQKLDEVVALQRALGGPGRGEAFTASRAARADRERVPRAERLDAQRSLGLPLLPTTTIGSFPQTTDLRVARAERAAGRLDETGYADAMRAAVREVIDLQSELGLDVLVHGEPERNDMVQYFAEQLEGYAATANGWVQSYGSRCVRPPILFGDVHRPEPMTVQWARYAQGLTDKPVKGMLTGPVTMLAWSFVRDDQPRSLTADQVGLALREETRDLEAAGISIIQVDEPALRETLPLRRAEQKAYLDWAVGSFRLATSGLAPRTQVHTHLCYSEFGEIVEAIDGLNADVTSVEAARSRMELLRDIERSGFAGAIGPGIYDIHSPRVPSTDELVELLRLALATLPAERLWVNPDCGLKTRGYAEVTESLRHLVRAAETVRAEIG